MIHQVTLASRDQWLEYRKGFIGGSDVAAIVGLNPWKSNLQLWREKTGRVDAEDISENELVRYGTNAEEHLRELFKLDYPQYSVEYKELNSWTNDKYPFAAASLDGWMRDKDSRLGILEIKTATISGAAQKAKWEDEHIPDNYYCQILFYMAVTDASFAMLTAQLKYEHPDREPLKVTKYYRIDRDESVEHDISYLMEKAEEFWSDIRADREPPMIIKL